jgi:ADP-heptose:LPS heptosyltransferase
MAPQRILLFHIGSLGDTLVSVPAFWAVRRHFVGARITMLTDAKLGQSLIQSNEILDGSGLIDDFLFYPTGDYRALAGLLLRLRREQFDILAYLIHGHTDERRVQRDKIFFRLAGIRQVVGAEGCPTPVRGPGPLKPSLHATDILLQRLAASGVPADPATPVIRQLGIDGTALDEVGHWLKDLPDPGARPWVGVGIGGKRPVTRWPLENYSRLIEELIEAHDIWPVVFGGPENREEGEHLTSGWQRGFVACGALGIRPTMAAMSRCRMFVGNDTGTIHMAAAAGVSCVGIYSSRNIPGLWSPYGEQHIVLRTPISCEGCRLEECTDRKMECILSISVQQAMDECQRLLRR